MHFTVLLIALSLYILNLHMFIQRQQEKYLEVHILFYFPLLWRFSFKPLVSVQRFGNLQKAKIIRTKIKVFQWFVNHLFRTDSLTWAPPIVAAWLTVLRSRQLKIKFANVFVASRSFDSHDVFFTSGCRLYGHNKWSHWLEIAAIDLSIDPMQRHEIREAYVDSLICLGQQKKNESKKRKSRKTKQMES